MHFEIVSFRWYVVHDKGTTKETALVERKALARPLFLLTFTFTAICCFAGTPSLQAWLTA